MKERDIAIAFSTGQFESCFNHLSKNVSWHIAGEKQLSGIDAVVQFCLDTAAYFASVETHFTIHHVLDDHGKIAVTGNAVFLKNNIKVSEVNSCDVYCFENGLLTEITSYCIVLK
ncbi:MAG: nuclear transport factor 2 family protein [Bacteroidia bacterium]|jgi:hypothetical protein|nr:nuclear transport factor 2 family protein [Bacteroidia bacterium]